MKTCPTCGNACDDQCLFCIDCGYKFEGDGNTANSNDNSNDVCEQNIQPPFQSQSQQNSQPPFQCQPQQNNQPPYQGQPQQYNQPPFQCQPQQNNQPPYQGQPQQNNQPPYQWQPQQNNQPPYQGQPQQNIQPPYITYEKPRNNPLAIASLVLGISGLVFACCYGAGIIPAILAIIFGAVSRNTISSPGNIEGGMGMSKAGLILGIISVAIAIITLIVIIVFGISALNLTNDLNNGGSFTSNFNT